MSLQSKAKSNFSSLLSQIQKDFPAIKFEADSAFRWSSERKTVFYDDSARFASWSLLHELGHMIRQHERYKSDSALVRMEVEAWDTALELADRYELKIDEDHIQDCIDSYRNWQFARSMCPRCSQTGAELSNGEYKCINCSQTWRVTTNRFCRVYRKLPK